MNFLPGTDPKLVEKAIDKWNMRINLPDPPPTLPTDIPNLQSFKRSSAQQAERLEQEREFRKKHSDTEGKGWGVSQQRRDHYYDDQKVRHDLQTHVTANAPVLPSPASVVQPTTEQKFADPKTFTQSFRRENPGLPVDNTGRTAPHVVSDTIRSMEDANRAFTPDLAIRSGKSFIPGANASGVRMVQSQAAKSGASLTGTDQFKRNKLVR